MIMSIRRVYGVQRRNILQLKTVENLGGLRHKYVCPVVYADVLADVIMNIVHLQVFFLFLRFS